MKASAERADKEQAELEMSSDSDDEPPPIPLLLSKTRSVDAFGGLVVGGLAYAFSGGDADVARVVLEPSVMGDYTITTEHLSGERKVEFFGRRRAN